MLSCLDAQMENSPILPLAVLLDFPTVRRVFDELVVNHDSKCCDAYLCETVTIKGYGPDCKGFMNVLLLCYT